MTSPSERRRFNRLGSRLTTVFTIRGTRSKRYALTRNLSRSGVCFILQEKLDVGTIVDAKLTLPDQAKPIVFVGIVVWNQPSDATGSREEDLPIRVGVNFVKIDPRDRSRIEHFSRMSALSDRF